MILGQPVVIRPIGGARVRKEDGTLLPDAGDTVIASGYWLRRVEDGDVEEVPEPIDSTKPKRARG